MVKVEINVHAKCRACLVQENEMHYLFTEFDNGLSLASILQTNFGIEDVSEEDGFPPFLCQNCTTTVVGCYNFKMIYLQSQNYLKSVINSSNEDIIIEEIMQEEGTASEIESTNENLDPLQENVSEANVDDGSFDYNFDEEKHLREWNEECNEENEFLEVTKYACDICGDCFLLKSGFQQHMIQMHNIANINPDFYSNAIHVKVKEENVKNSNKVIKHRCIKCKEEFASKEELSAHTSTHELYVCDICGHSFLRKADLSDHREVHSTEKKYECPFCKKKFKRRTVLVKHKKIHTHPRHAICHLCGLAFNDKGTLKTHIMLIHEKTRNYKCNLCHLTFPLKSTLDKHIRRHQPNREKAFSCRTCGMAYRDKSSLNRHVLVKHSGVNVKVSCHCGKEYTTAANLMKHQSKHHPIKIECE